MTGEYMDPVEPDNREGHCGEKQIPAVLFPKEKKQEGKNGEAAYENGSYVKVCLNAWKIRHTSVEIESHQDGTDPGTHCINVNSAIPMGLLVCSSQDNWKDYGNKNSTEQLKAVAQQ